MKFDDFKNAVMAIDLSDYSGLLNIGRKWKKIDDKAYNLKIAFIGSASIQLITSTTRALLAKYDIYPEVYEGEYNGILMDTMDMGSSLYRFEPDYIVILPYYRDILDRKPTVLAETLDVKNAVASISDNYIKIYETIHDRLPGTQIIMSNIVTPFYGPLGNLEANYIFSQKSFFEMVNLALVECKPSYVTIIDINGLSNYFGKKTWFDDSSYYLNKSGFSLVYIGYVADLIARQFEAFLGKTRKCLVLDLDNTLWGGIVGDLGYDGVNIDPNDAEGEAYQNFQKYILDLKNRGIILAVCSKNDEHNAKEPFEKNAHMVLKLDDISSFVANWNDKATNIKHIAKELNIGTDSFVFFDDNPTERMLVKEFLPEVRVIEVPNDPALYIRALDRSFPFEWIQITPEDMSRVKSYSDNIERNNLMDSCVNYEEYLKKLEMHISINNVDENSIARFTQLTNKTNQFNLRTQRYSEAEISRMMSDSKYELLTISLEDKFSNYGIIACVVLYYEGDVCRIINWVMSCRVLKKRVENYTIEKIVERAKAHGSNCVEGEYIKSKKNEMVNTLYEDLGFSIINENDEQAEYVLDANAMSDYKQIYYLLEDKNEDT